MKIEDNRPVNKLYTFGDLVVGECFCFTTTKNRFYMKIEEIETVFHGEPRKANVVNIGTGAVLDVDDCVMVDYLPDVKFVIE